ncbi:MAG: hypothetical protein CSYNP_03453 [Syntrophus sp. SKADARSKE-3]|nr:hypothetical protein [Syntrophus sp. SKADARSKE-3]MDQ5987708.1 hypothetical protein [Syntrophus sp. SKADARSKE-3]
MFQVLDNKTFFILKSLLCFIERYAMFGDIISVFAFVPLECRFFYASNVIQKDLLVNGNFPYSAMSDLDQNAYVNVGNRGVY